MCPLPSTFMGFYLQEPCKMLTTKNKRIISCFWHKWEINHFEMLTSQWKKILLEHYLTWGKSFFLTLPSCSLLVSSKGGKTTRQTKTLDNWQHQGTWEVQYFTDYDDKVYQVFEPLRDMFRRYQWINQSSNYNSSFDANKHNRMSPLTLLIECFYIGYMTFFLKMVFNIFPVDILALITVIFWSK